MGAKSALSDQCRVSIPFIQNCAIAWADATAGEKSQLTGLAAGTSYEARVTDCDSFRTQDVIVQAYCWHPFMDTMTTMGYIE